MKEQMANKVHEIWAAWMTYVFNRSRQNKDGSVTIPKDLVDRWCKQIATPYENLSVQEQESDKVIAEEILLLVQGK